MEITTRSQALVLGLTRYFTGKACPHDHVSERLVSSRACAECVREKKHAWNKAHVVHATAVKSAWVKANPERNKVAKAKSQKKHREAANARNTMYRNANLEKTRAASGAWAKANPARVAAKAAAYRADRLQATPAWADIGKIEAYFTSAEGLRMLLGEHYHVDHILPLRGKRVCGLHVHNNLQILTAQANRSKSNSFKE